MRVFPLARPLARKLASPLIGDDGGLSFATAKNAVQMDSSDVNMLVIGDSTGDATTEWVYLFGEWLATEYPTHSVSYRLWDDATDVYAAATAISTGSGANTIHIWNASVSGSSPVYLMGGKFAAAIGALSPELIIWNHGHNVIDGSPVYSQARGEVVAAVEQVMQAHPGVPHAMILQNPRRDDEDMASIIAIQREYAAERTDITLVDVYTRFIAQGKDASLYADDIHPSEAGSLVFRQAVSDKWSASPASNYSALDAWLDTQTTNLLTNGDFSDWPSSVPTGWASFQGGAATKEATIVDSPSTQSMKVTGTSANAMIRQVLDSRLEEFAGKTITVAARMYVPDVTSLTAGRITILGAGTSGGLFTIHSPARSGAGRNGFRWVVLSGYEVPADVTALRIGCTCDSAANTDSAAYFDRMILVEGNIPRDMA